MFSKVLAELDRDEYLNMMEQLREETKNFAGQVRSLQDQCLRLTKEARSLEDRNQSLEDENRRLRELLQNHG